MIRFADDFKNRPEVLSQIMMSDFGFTALDSHTVRLAITTLWKNEVPYAESRDKATFIGSDLSIAPVPKTQELSFKRPKGGQNRIIVTTASVGQRNQSNYGLSPETTPRALQRELDDFQVVHH